MTIETWLAFLVACWIISLSPGAGAIASMSSGLNYGFVRGYWTALGLQLGLLLQKKMKLNHSKVDGYEYHACGQTHWSAP